MSDELTARLKSLRIEPGDRRTGSGTARHRPLLWTAVLMALVALPLGGWIAGNGWKLGVAAVAGTPSANGTPPAPAGGSLAADQVTATGEQAPLSVLTAGGRIAADQTVHVATKVSGRVVELRVQQGDRVEAGQPIARLDNDEYQSVRDLRAAQLAEAEADLGEARHDHDQTAGLRQREMVSTTEWAHAEAALARCEARLAAARAGLRLAERQLADCLIAAPLAGTVLETHVSAGDIVAAEGGRGGDANGLVATIADTTRLRVELDVPEQDLARVVPSMRCLIVPDAYPQRRYDGRVLWIDPAGNYSQGAVGVKVRIEAPDGFVRIGCGARVEFLAER